MSQSPELHAGVARIVVTPPVGIPMSGFGGRGPATSVHDDLYATALVLESGDERAAIVAADLIGFSDEFVTQVRAEAHRRCEIPEANVFLCGSHTHYGPTTKAYTMEEGGPDVEAYVANLVHLIAGAVQEAASATEPVRVGVGRGASDVGVNRRERKPDGAIVLGQNPDGPIDREAIVVRLDTLDGAPLAMLVNFACHGVCQSSATRAVSADFVAPMRDLVEDVTGASSLYLQGACANINPWLMEASFEPARVTGVRLGGAVIGVFEQIAAADASGLAVCSGKVEFPAQTFGDEAETRTRIADLEQELAKLKGNGGAESMVKWCENRLEQARRALQSLAGGEPLEPIVGEVACVRFGDVAILMAPGEVFNQIGAEVKQRSPVANTLFVGYSNGSIGYVPTPEAYPEGGYEVTRACRVGPESARNLIDEALRQLAAVASR